MSSGKLFIDLFEPSSKEELAFKKKEEEYMFE